MDEAYTPGSTDDGVQPPVTTDYRYAPIPEAVLYDTDLSAQAVRIYGALMRRGLDPGSCFPSHDDIGKHVGLAGRSVQRPLAELVEAGWITKTKRFNKRGERTSDGYHVHTIRADVRDTTAQDGEVVQRAETSEEGEPLEPSNETHRDERAADNTSDAAPTDAQSDSEFNVAYSAYPVRNGRAAARAAWNRATAIWPAATILAAIVTYKTDPARIARGARYTPSMAKWLDDRGWEQPAEPPPSPPEPRPDEQTAAAARRRWADQAEREAGQACTRCNNVGVYEHPDGGAVRCEHDARVTA